MRKINSVFLIVVGFLIQCGNAQSPLSGGKAKVSSNEQGSWILASLKGAIIPENDGTDQKSNVSAKPETRIQLDSVTNERIDVAIMEAEEQAEVTLQDSVIKVMRDNPVQDHDISGAINTSRVGTDAAQANSSLSLKRLTPNEMVEMIVPYLVADREDFARDITAALQRCKLRPVAPTQPVAE